MTYLIAENLIRDGIPSPSGYDHKRNPHRPGLAWSKSAVRALLVMPTAATNTPIGFPLAPTCQYS